MKIFKKNTLFCPPLVMGSLLAASVSASPQQHNIALKEFERNKRTPQALKNLAHKKTKQRFIVRFHDDHPHSFLNYTAVGQSLIEDNANALTQAPTQHKKRMAMGASVIELDSTNNARSLKAMLKKIDGVKSVSIDYLRYSYQLNDPYYEQGSWGLWNTDHLVDTGKKVLAAANFEKAWEIEQGKPEISVAVVDTGLLKNHEDLKGRSYAGYDFIHDKYYSNDGDGRDSDASDSGDHGCGYPSSWHGTHVAGIIAANNDNGIGTAGANWHSKVMPIRVLGACGTGFDSDIIDGSYWAAGFDVSGTPSNPFPSQVINLSLGGESECTDAYQTMVYDFKKKGISIVTAAGNEGSYNVRARESSPGNCNGVINVGALEYDGGRPNYSNFDDNAGAMTISLSAPGGNANAMFGSQNQYGIYSSSNLGTGGSTTDSYVAISGTSQSAPHVSAAISLMLSHNRHLTVDTVKAILERSAAKFIDNFPAYAQCHTSNSSLSSGEKGCGAGMLDAHAALVETQKVHRVEDSIYKVTKNSTFQDSIQVTDHNGSPITEGLVFSVWRQPTRGSIAIDAYTGQFSYQSASTLGKDSLEIRTTAKNGDSTVHTLTFNDSETNISDMLIGLSEPLLVNQNGILTYHAQQHFSDTALYSISTAPQHGSAVISELGYISYWPAADYQGEDSFEVTYNTGHSTYTLSIPISVVESLPQGYSALPSNYDNSSSNDDNSSSNDDNSSSNDDNSSSNDDNSSSNDDDSSSSTGSDASGSGGGNLPIIALLLLPFFRKTMPWRAA